MDTAALSEGNVSCVNHIAAFICDTIWRKFNTEIELRSTIHGEKQG